MASKITIKHFLNKRVKSELNQSGEAVYPLYCQVTYKRKNTQFLFNLKRYLGRISVGSIDEIFKGDVHDVFHSKFSENSFLKSKPILDEIFKYEKIVIEQLIEFEEERFKNNFKLSGVGERLWIYNYHVHGFIGSCVKDDLDHALELNIDLKYCSQVLEDLSIFDLIDKVSFIERNFDKKIKSRIDKELWNKIYSYYLLLSFVENSPERYPVSYWLFDQGLARFAIYIKDMIYLDKTNPYLDKIKKFESLDLNLCIKLVEERLNLWLRDVDDFYKETRP